MHPRPHSSLLALILFLASVIATEVVGQEPPEQVIVPMLFQTDRAETGEVEAADWFSSERGTVQWGMAEVAISTNKQGDSTHANWGRWAPREGKTRNKNELLTIMPLDREAAKAVALAGRETADVLVYIHGYARDFPTAATDFARVIYEADITAVPLLYSWPSHGGYSHYVGDLNNLEWSTLHLRQMLEGLIDDPMVGTVHVLAHSMGNQALLHALRDIAAARDGAWSSDWGEIVLFAPDVDSDIFTRDFMPMIQNSGVRFSLYVSQVDVPLQTSKRLNRVWRIGDSGDEVYIADGIDTIDVSSSSTIFDGHSAHLDNPVIQADLHYLFNQRRPVNNRPTLLPATSPNGSYWNALDEYP